MLREADGVLVVVDECGRAAYMAKGDSQPASMGWSGQEVAGEYRRAAERVLRIPSMLATCGAKALTGVGWWRARCIERCTPGSEEQAGETTV